MNPDEYGMYKPYIEARAKECAKFIILTGATCKEAAKKFGISESTVYIDMTKRLSNISEKMYKDVRKVMELNKAEAFLRGGLTTKERHTKW